MKQRAFLVIVSALALQIIAGSVVFISCVAMFLVLLPIQRNVRMIRETGGRRSS